MSALRALMCATALCVGGCAATDPGQSSTPLRPAQPPPPPGCPASATELPPTALYGTWQARFDNDAGAVAIVQLSRHPDYEGSVRGTIDRGGFIAQLAGDIDDAGILNLDESQDGRSISAVWSGDMQTAQCGKEFKGTWRNSKDDSTRPFTLTREGSWR